MQLDGYFSFCLIEDISPKTFLAKITISLIPKIQPWTQIAPSHYRDVRRCLFLIKNKDIFFTKQKNVAKYMDPFFRRHLPTLDCIKYNTISSYTLHHLEKCLILWNTEITIDIFLDINRFIACIFTKYSRLGKHVLVWARNKTQSSKLPKNRNLWHHIDWNRV